MVRRTAEHNRLAETRGRLQTAIAAPSPWLNERRATLDHAITTLRRESPWWRDNDDLVPSAPGMGPMCARTWRLALPA